MAVQDESFVVIDEPVAILSPGSLPQSLGITPPRPPGDGNKRFPSPISKKFLLASLVVLFLVGVGGLAFFGVSRFLGKGEKRENVEIVWWGLWEEEETVAPLIEEYQSRNPGVTIKYVKQSPQDYRARLVSSLAKGPGAGPDIFRIHNTWVPMLKNDLSSVPADVFDSSNFSEIFYPTATQDLSYGGRLVGIPLMIDGLGLYVNEEIFEKNNVSWPVTWQELRESAIALTQKDEEGRITQAGVSLGTVNNVDHWQDVLSLMFLQNNADLAAPSDKRAEDAILFYTIFTTVDKVWDETLPPSTLAFASGKLAMYIAPSWQVFEIKKRNPNLRFRIVPVPQLPKSGPGEKDVTWANYWAEGVWERSSGKEEAFLFLKFLSEKEQLDKLYNNVAKTRLFGEPPARRDMAASRLSDPYVGAYLEQAETARSWYLASRTLDGPTGINSRISKYFEDAVNSIRRGDSPEAVLSTLSKGVRQVLGDYGIQ